MLRKVFTKENFIINSFLAGVIFVVYVVFLGHTFGSAFTTSLVFVGILFVFDFVIAVLKKRAAARNE